jgi:hypothetical protein
LEFLSVALEEDEGKNSSALWLEKKSNRSLESMQINSRLEFQYIDNLYVKASVIMKFVGQRRYIHQAQKRVGHCKEIIESNGEKCIQLGQQVK